MGSVRGYDPHVPDGTGTRSTIRSRSSRWLQSDLGSLLPGYRPPVTGDGGEDGGEDADAEQPRADRAIPLGVK